ncbi:MAG: 50S ribosomal protein L25 [Thermoleophilia bacterium]
MSSDHVQLQAAERTAFGSAASRRLRRQGLVPGILYQAGKDAVPFQVPHHDLFMKLQVGHGKTAVFEISVGGAPAVPALLKDWQMNPVRAELEHVDFQQVDLKVAVQASVPLVLVGQSQGVRDGGVLDQPLREITVEALPDAIPAEIEVDVTELAAGGVLHLSDVRAPSGVTVVGEDELVIASVTVPSDIADGVEEEEGAEPELVGGDEEE